MLRATCVSLRPCAGSCLFLVTRATTVGLEHGGPPTAALGPYHSAMVLGGVPITLGGVVVVGVCLLVTGDVRCPCPAQGQSRLVPSYCLDWNVCEIGVPLLIVMGRVQKEVPSDKELPGVEPISLHGCEYQYGSNIYIDSFKSTAYIASITHRSVCSPTITSRYHTSIAMLED